MMKKKTIAMTAIGMLAVAVACALYINDNTRADNVANDKILTRQPLTAQDQSAVKRGHYLAIAGDCVACHTAPGSKQPYSGGYGIETPFGKIYASNITPDPSTGIGNWTERDFYRAVRHGIGKQGENLYPAMPYNAYVKISDQDMHDLWMYIRSLTPVQQHVTATSLPFPFNIRFAMRGWNLLFFKNSEFKVNASQSAQWNRGAYLVEGLEHCAACHTPKNMLGGDTHAYLQGNNLGTWHAPDITSNTYTGMGKWSEQQIVDYLKNGSNHVAIASGPMAEAVSNSTQYLSDDDLHAIAVYLRTQPSSPTHKPAPLNSTSALMQSGERVYSANCSACHNSDGKGIPQIAASLADNPSIMAQDPSSILTTILQGGRGAVTQNNPTSAAMPSFAWKLSDQQIAAVTTYIRNSWGNSAPAVHPEKVTASRKALQLPEQQKDNAVPHSMAH